MGIFRRQEDLNPDSNKAYIYQMPYSVSYRGPLLDYLNLTLLSLVSFSALLHAIYDVREEKTWDTGLHNYTLLFR